MNHLCSSNILLFVIMLFASSGIEADEKETSNHCSAYTSEFGYDVTLVLHKSMMRVDSVKGLIEADFEIYMCLKDSSASYSSPSWGKHALGWSMFREGLGTKGKIVRSYNAVDHEITIDSVSKDSGFIHFDLRATINSDGYVSGDSARYVVRVKREGDSLKGAYQGFFGKQAIKNTVSGFISKKLWPSPAADYKPLQAGEHPRLIFRKEDLPQLRKRIYTPEGKIILNRLKEIVASKYTLWNGAAYGFLFQLTNEKRYADLGRMCVQEAFDGKKDVDKRYSWKSPDGRLRAGPSYSAIALAYDLCYDGWPENFRKKVAQELQAKVFPSLIVPTSGGQLDPASNHYGAWKGGAGLCMLAIMGDRGVDDSIVARSLRMLERNAKRTLKVGFGETGYFYEGTHCGRISGNTGLFQYLQALKVAAGRDLLTNEAPGKWLCVKWIYELLRQNGKIDSYQRGMYAKPFKIGGMSEGGDFAFGLGLVPKEERPAIAWFYKNVIEQPKLRTYDAVSYPHYAIYSFVNWPIGVPESNPSAFYSSFVPDSKSGYYMIRNQWKDSSDIIVSIETETAIIGQGLNKYYTIGLRPFGKLTSSLDQDSLLTWTIDYPSKNKDRKWVSAGVDFTSQSGLPALVVFVTDKPELLISRQNENARKKAFDSTYVGTTIQLTVGKLHYTILMFKGCEMPEVTADSRNGQVIIGNRIISCNGSEIIMLTKGN